MSTSAPPRPPGSRLGGRATGPLASGPAGPPGPAAAAARAAAEAARPLDAPAPRPRPTLRLVGPSRRVRRRLLGTVLVTIGFVTLFVLAAMQAMLVQGQLRLDRLNGDIAKAETTKDQLQLQVDTLESPDRLAQEAKQLGMVPAPDVVFLYAPPVTTGAPTATSGAPAPAPAATDGAPAPTSEAPAATPDGGATSAAAHG